MLSPLAGDDRIHFDGHHRGRLKRARDSERGCVRRDGVGGKSMKAGRAALKAAAVCHVGTMDITPTG
jgi:hypothetical protein